MPAMYAYVPILKYASTVNPNLVVVSLQFPKVNNTIDRERTWQTHRSRNMDRRKRQRNADHEHADRTTEKSFLDCL